MPLTIVREDLTRMRCDAVVNATDPFFSGSGGVDMAIHQAAGPALRRACGRLGGCRPGEAKLTKAYRLPCRYVIHTVGPVWHGGSQGEEAVLRSCYREALRLAEKKGCRSIAFPPIASESLGYPKEEALRIASDEILRFLEHSEMQVSLVVFGRESFAVGKKLFTEVAEFIDQNYVELHSLGRSQNWRPYDAQTRFDAPAAAAPPPFSETVGAAWPAEEEADGAALPMPEEAFRAPCPVDAGAAPLPAARPKAASAPGSSFSLEKLLGQLDESFSQMLLRKIDERGMTDAQCYKRANIDRKLFSKIRSNSQYKPSKPTAVAFAIALELSEAETRELLEKAGFALSRSSIFDVIILYFLQKGVYDLFQINEVLFAYDQSLLGG